MATEVLGTTRGTRYHATGTSTGVSAETLQRLCGVSLLVAGVLAVVGHVAIHPPGHAIQYQRLPNWTPAHVISMLSFMLGALGALGLYVRVKDRVGLPGLVAVTLLFFGLCFHAMSMEYEAFMVPALLDHNTTGLTAPDGPLGGAPFLGFGDPMRGIVEIAGLLSFSVVMIMSRFARGGAITMLIGSAVLSAWVLIIGPGGLITGLSITVLQIGMGWMGYQLYRSPAQAIQQEVTTSSASLSPR